jgi:uncharacterized MAPEG superfamily protein
MQLADQPAFAAWATTTALFFVKLFGNSAVQGLVRLKNRQFVKPEDARFYGRNAPPAAEEHVLVQRAAAVWRNDLENIPMFLLLALGLVLAGDPGPWTAGLCGLFFVARLAHTAFFLAPRQPHRNIAYQLGILSCFLAVGRLLWLVWG